MEITVFEFSRIMGENAPNIKVFCQNTFCPNCVVERDYELVDYSINVTEQNDLLLNGKCSGCHGLASRLIETGEDLNKVSVIQELQESKE